MTCPIGLSGWWSDRLRIDPAGGVDRAHLRQQRPEFVERAEIGRRLAQDIDEGVLGVLPPVEGAEQHRALDFGFDGIVSARAGARAARQAAAASIPAPAGAPSRDRCWQCQARRAAFCFSPVTMRAGSASMASITLIIC